MPKDELPHDPESLKRWQELPQNPPSKEALPPMTGGNRWGFGLLIVLGALIILALVLQFLAPS